MRRRLAGETDLWRAEELLSIGWSGQPVQPIPGRKSHDDEHDPELIDNHR